MPVPDGHSGWHLGNGRNPHASGNNTLDTPRQAGLHMGVVMITTTPPSISRNRPSKNPANAPVVLGSAKLILDFPSIRLHPSRCRTRSRAPPLHQGHHAFGMTFVQDRPSPTRLRDNRGLFASHPSAAPDLGACAWTRGLGKAAGVRRLAAAVRKRAKAKTGYPRHTEKAEGTLTVSAILLLLVEIEILDGHAHFL